MLNEGRHPTNKLGRGIIMNLLNIFLVILLIAGLLLVVFSFQKRSLLSISFGVVAFLAPIFYFIGWTVFLPLVPVIALVISFLGKKRKRSA